MAVVTDVGMSGIVEMGIHSWSVFNTALANVYVSY